MLVKFTRAHIYTGPKTEDADHDGQFGARKGRIELHAVRDVPVSYFEKYLEPYGWAHAHNVSAEEAKELHSGLKTMSVQGLRDLADKNDLEVEGTGKGGRLTKKDLIKALSGAGIGAEDDDE